MHFFGCMARTRRKHCLEMLMVGSTITRSGLHFEDKLISRMRQPPTRKPIQVGQSGSTVCSSIPGGRLHCLGDTQLRFALSRTARKQVDAVHGTVSFTVSLR